MPEKEYIEREAAKQKLAPAINDPDAIDFWEWQCSEIDSIPAADVREVVYCRDCKHYKPQKKSARWSNTTPMCSRSATIKMPPDGFCSFGVKREE